MKILDSSHIRSLFKIDLYYFIINAILMLPMQFAISSITYTVYTSKYKHVNFAHRNFLLGVSLKGSKPTLHLCNIRKPPILNPKRRQNPFRIFRTKKTETNPYVEKYTNLRPIFQQQQPSRF